MHTPARLLLPALLLVAGLALSLSVPAFADDEPPKKSAKTADKADNPGPATGVALIEVHGPLMEQPHPLTWLMGVGKEMTLRDLVGLIREGADDANIQSVVLRLRETPLTLTQAEEIGAAITKARAAGKKVHLFCENYETADAVLGSYCDEAIMQAGGAISVPGMYMEEMYLADTFTWAGLTPQMVQVGDYKGANEEYMRTSPSPQWEQNISGLLDGLYGNVRRHLKDGRKLDDAKLDDAMKQSWMALSDTAMKTGLVDSAVDLLDLTPHLEKKLGASELAWSDYTPGDGGSGFDSSNPFDFFRKITSAPQTSPTRASIAVVYITGPIMDGESKEGGFMGEASVGSYTVRRALGEIEEEPLIKGVVIRIDSPGGSAIASEVIWQGLKRMQTKKPVWISVGSMAASGGYYCLVGGQRVYVNPSSIVGSIGVVGGKFAMTGLFDKLKIHTHGRERGPMGRMLASSSPWTSAEQALVRAKMQETYDLFTNRVSEGRPGIDLSKTAEGRLFTGDAAIKNKMADKIGGLDDCITDLAADLKLTPGEYEILEYPGPKSMFEVLGDALGGFVHAPGTPSARADAAQQMGSQILFGAMKEVVGPKQWPQIRDHLSAFMQLRKEPVILTSPRAIIVK